MKFLTSLLILLLIVVGSACKRTYVCVCETPAVDTVLRRTTEFRGLRKAEAEIEEENCENDPICSWEELL